MCPHTARIASRPVFLACSFKEFFTACLPTSHAAFTTARAMALANWLDMLMNPWRAGAPLPGAGARCSTELLAYEIPQKLGYIYLGFNYPRRGL